MPECAVVPNGALSGADGLTVFVAVRNGGPGTADGLVPVEISDGTGVRARVSSGISTGAAVSPLGVELTPADYGRTHRFVVTADPAPPTGPAVLPPPAAGQRLCPDCAAR